MFKIAIMGFGVVGQGVYEVLRDNADKIAACISPEATAPAVDIKYILDRLDFPDHPYADRVVKDLDIILADDEVSVVVETMGGTGAAVEFSRRALEAGKSVVTSNKAAVDKSGELLEKIAYEHGVSYMYEASVGGGIPIIYPLNSCFAGNTILKIAGILNGTTNYMLTKMKNDKLSFAAALKLAQDKGFAEANPENDIKAYDSARKICILAGIAFGRYIPYDEMQVIEGIEEVTDEDISLAESMGYTIKLIACAEDVGGRLKLFVAPLLVGRDSIFGATNGVFNAVSVTGSAVGEVVFYGRGAGSLPTASAIISDVVEVIKCCPTPQIRRKAESGFLLDAADFGDKMLTLPNGKVYRVYE